MLNRIIISAAIAAVIAVSAVPANAGEGIVLRKGNKSFQTVTSNTTGGEGQTVAATPTGGESAADVAAIAPAAGVETDAEQGQPQVGGDNSEGREFQHSLPRK